MNENNAIDTIFIDNVCRVCLDTKDLSSMSDEHTKMYISLINEMVYKECNTKICVICKWMLQKCIKFKHQCLTANNLLKGTSYMDQNSSNKLTNSHNITQTNPSIHSYTHTYTNTDTHTDITLYPIHTHTYNKQDFENKFLDDIKIYEDVKVDCLEVFDNFGNDFQNDDDEDELPLVMISKKSKKSKKKCKKKKLDLEKPPELLKQETEIKNETSHIETEEKPKKKQKVLKEGFTSRMVQETEEYIVIKLTKEQVLQEMAERSKTEAYVKSRFKCEKCVKGFNFQDVLDTHMEKHIAKSGWLLCEICEQYCPSVVSLRGHMKSHTTKYSCRICGTVRAARQHLLEHHAQHSGAAPAYSCLHCPLTSSKRTVMQRHARAHTRRSPRACAACGKLFHSATSLRLHTARHDQSSRYKCSECPARFLLHSALRSHARSVHERRDLYCVECDIHFKCAETLRVHFKNSKKHRDPTVPKHASTHSHKQHACTHCHRLYSTRSALRSHAWRAHDAGPHACSHCGLHFQRKTMLKAHERALQGACGDTQKKEELSHYENKMEV